VANVALAILTSNEHLQQIKMCSSGDPSTAGSAKLCMEV